MKKMTLFLMLLVLLVGLCGCASSLLSATSFSETVTTVPATSTTPATTVPATSTTPVTTVPATSTTPVTTSPTSDPSTYIPENPVKLTPDNLAGKMFVYEKIGPHGPKVDAFWIGLYVDGTFGYHAGFFSSHYGMGTWSIEGNVLCLYEDNGDSFYFQITEDALVFMEENEDYFLYVDVKPGERFFAVPE